MHDLCFQGVQCRFIAAPLSHYYMWVCSRCHRGISPRMMADRVVKAQSSALLAHLRAYCEV